MGAELVATQAYPYCHTSIPVDLQWTLILQLEGTILVAPLIGVQALATLKLKQTIMTKLNLLFFTILYCFSPLTLLAQEQGPGGLILEDQIYEKMLTHTVERSNIQIPDRIDLKPYCPTPGDQDRLPSCVAWALCYTRTIIEAIEQGKQNSQAGKCNNQNRIDPMMLSVSYVYNQIKVSDCLSGAKYSSGLELLVEQGVCRATSFKISGTDCRKMPSLRQRKAAALFKIRSYKKLFEIDQSAEEKVILVQSLLAEKKPVPVGMMVDHEFVKLSSGKAKWVSKSNRGGLYHAMVVIGYNETEETFELLNSYGTDWGKCGTVKISFEQFGKSVRYAFNLEL